MSAEIIIALLGILLIIPLHIGISLVTKLNPARRIYAVFVTVGMMFFSYLFGYIQGIAIMWVSL